MAERQEITVRAELRAGRGKNDARRLRARGLVPLTIYGGEGEPVAAAAPLRELAAILRTGAGHNAIFTLDVDGIGANEVMFLDRQIDPVKSRLIHADLRRLVRGQEVEVTVRIELEGEPEGAKEEGGIVEQLLREVEIRCRPGIIPDSILVDVSGLGVHEVLHVSDIKVAEGITIMTDPETAVATLAVVREEAVEAAAPVEEAVEPEVIGKGKKEDEEA
ncbi:MAG: large subunit ribosomal protein [Acidobacteriota bacterium]|jgi:large subunit ribosomal protein L25|nr:large subunit ribosomal protein [Acidobacteriota bacterium]